MEHLAGVFLHVILCWLSTNTVSRQVSSPLGVVLAGFAKFDNEIRGCAPSGLTTSVRVLCSQWAARHESLRAMSTPELISPIPRYELLTVHTSVADSHTAVWAPVLQSLRDLAHTAV